MGSLRFWTTLGALIAVIGLALPATGPARMSAAASSSNQWVSSAGRSNATSPVAVATPTVVGVMGAASRAQPQTPVARQAAICASGTPLQGIDVSYYQGSFQNSSINWFQVAQSGRSFAYARAADGLTFVDPDFHTNYAGIKAAGMKAGAYLFFRPAQDPTAQADALISALHEANFGPGDLVPVLDVEVLDGQSGATVAANLQRAINVVQGALGVTPAIYTAPLWWNGNVGATGFGADPLWIANWGVSCPGVPNGWTSWVIWQFNDNSGVPGINGNVDGDESNGQTMPIYRPLPPRVLLPVVSNQAP